jgi:hypothetical protein
MNHKYLKYSVIGTFVSLYLVVSVISTIHVVQFFDLTNPKWLSVSLAVAFELGAAASLASLIALDKMNKLLVWVLFIVLTCMQAMGNSYYAYINIQDFSMWSELFGLVDEEIIYQKRILSIISGAILPLVALGFIKSLVDYIKPEDQLDTEDLKPESFDNQVETVSEVAADAEILESQNSKMEETEEKEGIKNSEEIVINPVSNVGNPDEMQKANYNAALVSAQKRRPGLGM